MGMLVVLGVIVFIVLVGALFVHAIRKRDGRHGWLVVVPLIVLFGWLIEQLLIGR